MSLLYALQISVCAGRSSGREPRPEHFEGLRTPQDVASPLCPCSWRLSCLVGSMGVDKDPCEYKLQVSGLPWRLLLLDLPPVGIEGLGSPGSSVGRALKAGGGEDHRLRPCHQLPPFLAVTWGDKSLPGSQSAHLPSRYTGCWAFLPSYGAEGQMKELQS